MRAGEARPARAAVERHRDTRAARCGRREKIAKACAAGYATEQLARPITSSITQRSADTYHAYKSWEC